MLGNYNPAQLGLYGFTVIEDTDLHEDEYVRIVIITDAAFSSLTGNTDVTLPFTFKAGEDLGGVWSAIQLTTGTIRAYKGSD
jgi:hypothetical protein